VLRNKRRRRMQKVSGENGGGGEVGVGRRDTKRRRIEEDLENEDVGLGGDGVQGWFGGGNGNGLTVGEEIARLFGEVSDGSMQQLWACGDGPEFGESASGNVDRVLGGSGGGGEGVQGGFGEVISGIGGLGLDGEASQLWGSEDACENGGEVPGGQGSHVDGFGRTACEVDGLILGGGEEIKNAYGEGLDDGKAVQLWNSGNDYPSSTGVLGGQGIQAGGSIENAFKNDGLGFDSEGFQDFFSKVNDQNLVDVRIQALSGEGSVGNSGLSFGGEGIQFWFGEVARTNLDGKGVQGHFGDNVCGNGGETLGGSNGDRQEVVGLKGKRGRPKGSKNKNKTFAADAKEGIERFEGAPGENGIRDAVVRSKGRPKGSKNKKKSLEMNKNHETPGNNVDGNSNEQGTLCLTALDNERLILVGDKDTGSVVEVAISCNELGNEIVGQKKKRGRPKGSKSKKRMSGEVVIDNGGDEIVRPTCLKYERQTLVGEEERKLPFDDATRSEGGNEITRPKGKRGRPKGSKSKKESSAGQENQGMPGDIGVVNDGGDKTVCRTSVENGKLNSVGQEDRGLPIDDVEGGSGIVWPKNKRGRPKGSKNKQKILIGKENQGMPCKLMGRNDGSGVETFWPMWSENERPTLVSEEDQEMAIKATGGNGSADKIIQPKDNRKGSKHKRVIIVGEALNKILAQRHQDYTFPSKLVPVEQLRYSGEIETESKELTSEPGKVWKRPRGRPRKFNNEQCNSDGFREGRPTSNGLENSGLSVSYFASIFLVIIYLN
jgi:lysine-specific demethylase 3